MPEARVYRVLERVVTPDGRCKISAVLDRYPGARVVLHGQDPALKLGDPVTLERDLVANHPAFVKYSPASQEAAS